MLQAVPDAGDRGVVEAPEDELEKMHDQAARIGTATLTRYAEVVHAGLGEMRGATAPRLLLEVVCARLLLPSASDTESALLQRVERIETRLDMSIPAADRADSGPAARRVAAAIQPAKPGSGTCANANANGTATAQSAAGRSQPSVVPPPPPTVPTQPAPRAPDPVAAPSAPPPEARAGAAEPPPVALDARRAGRGCRAHHVVDRA